MRRPKHRRHPDIWRERHMAEKLGERRWGPAFRPSIPHSASTATLTIQAMQAVFDRIVGGTITL